jgi:hypothetical protein
MVSNFEMKNSERRDRRINGSVGLLICFCGLLLTTQRIPCARPFVQQPSLGRPRPLSSPITPLFVASSGSNGEEKRQGIEDLPGPEDTTEENIRSLFALFNNALATYVRHAVCSFISKGVH